MRRIFLHLIVLSLLFAPVGQAAIVHYFDEEGKIHYVNTDYFKVPARYRDQVKDQLEPEVKAKKQVESGGCKTCQEKNATITDEKQKDEKQKKEKPKVELFMRVGCKKCDRLDIILRANRIPLSRYDADTNPYGQQVYAEAGEPDLPLTRVGTDFVYGDSIHAVKRILTLFNKED